MKLKFLLYALAAAAGFLVSSCEKDEVKKDRVNFENFVLGPEGFYNGSDMAGGFQAGNAVFNNSYNSDYGSWSGFSVSAHTDVETAEYTNQYSSIAGSGADGSEKYAVLYTWQEDTIEFIVPEKITNISFCNSTYAYYAMLEGNAVSKKFGGESGDDPDYFLVNIKAIDEAGNQTLSGQIYLADFTSQNNAEDYIGNAWTDIDLKEAGYVKYLVFSFESSDVGNWGINTPTYVCIDNIFGELQD